MEPTEPSTEENQPPNLASQSELDDIPNHQDWWDNADVYRLIKPEAFRRFLYGYDQLLKNLDSDRDNNEVASPTIGSITRPSSDEQSKLKQSPLVRG